MNIDSEKTGFIDQGWYLSYMRYYATGEGVTLCIAVGRSAEYAENVLKERIDEYFHRAVETRPITREMGKDVQVMLEWVPEAVKENFRQIPFGAGYYFSELYYNLA